MTDSLEVSAVVICDDIRREANGKEILIGVYNDIKILGLPAVMPNFGIRIEFITPEAISQDFVLEIINPQEEVIFSANCPIKTSGEENSGSLSVVQGPFFLNSEGTYKILFGKPGAKKIVRKFKVSLQKSTH